jgi:hypothetical protein
MKEAVRRRTYLYEAVLTIALARLAVFLLPARCVFSWANKHPRRLSRFRDEEVPWIGWAVDCAAQRMRVGLSSLSGALAIQTMLRRRGITSRLCLGIAPGETVTSHAWVELPDGCVVGPVDAKGLIKFPLFEGSAQARATAS